jgi:uncharacterized membrane protein
MEANVLITSDAVILGVLFLILAAVFYTHDLKSPFWKKFYTYCPMILVCYFLPSILTSFGVYDPSASKLYYVVSRYLLPASLVLLIISVDLREIAKLGKKAIIIFLTGTLGIVFGGPISLMICSVISPDLVSDPDIWRGMSTVAGSWIGGGANQAAMKEVFEVGDELFSAMVTVDVIVANIWMAFLLFGAGKMNQIDKKLNADNSVVHSLIKKMEDYHSQNAKVSTTTSLMVIGAIAFGATAFSHMVANHLAPWFQENAPHLSKFSLTSHFLWLIVTATTIGLILSFTKLRKYEGFGASKIGSVFIFLLVTTIGMKMNVLAIFETPGLFFIGIVWILFHVVLLLTVAKLIRAPFFLVAVGSQANIGGAASAPVVASAFSPALAPVGVLLAVLGYAVGTYGAWICAQLMRISLGG